MVTVPERLGRIEERLNAQDELIERNYHEGRHDRANMKMMIEGVGKKVDGLVSLFDQAKGARWLAGTLLTAVGGLALVGAKVIIEWLLAR